MFERFTEQARMVVVLARDEARLMRHDHIGTEHLVAGLARVDDDVAGPILAEAGLGGERARAEAVRQVGVGDEAPGGQIPFTPAAKQALEATLHEALSLGHSQIEPAHLLLGALRQPDGVARRMLAAKGVNPPDVRAEVVRRLQARPAPDAAAAGAQAAAGGGDAVPVRVGEELVGDLGNPAVDGRLLLAILAGHGAVAAWLRERGVDEDVVRRMLG